MNIEIKKSIKPINYFDAINLLEKRLENLHNNIDKELIWTLEHNEIFTAGTSFKESEILDNSIELIKTNRGGKITCHAPGQLVCYFVLDLRKKKKIRIWQKKNNSINKVAAIGVRVKKWIAYHGFAININNNLEQYKKIIPCGITDKGVTNLVNINNNDYSDLDKILIKKFISNLKI